MDIDRAVKILESEFGKEVHVLGNDCYVDQERMTQEEIIELAEKLKYNT